MNIKRDMKLTVSTINSKEDQFIIKSKYSIEKPFYRWMREHFNDQIDYLLSGKQIYLRSNVFDINIKNAVKFRNVQLKLRTDKDLQHKLDTLLNNFQINLTHIGNHYFKCDHKYFMINGEKLVITHGFKEDLFGQPKQNSM